MSKPTVLIVGAGVAGLETLIALRSLAGDRADVTLIAPEEEFVDRPMQVTEPFGAGRARRYPLAEIAADHEAGLIGSAVVAVDAAQADVVAADIASELGAPVDPQPFRPVLRGMLLTGAEERFLRTRAGRDEAAWQPLWWPPTKIAGRHLAPYLFARGEAGVPQPPPVPFTDLEVPLSAVSAPD